MSDDATPARPRLPNPDSVHAKIARRLVQPVQLQLDHWQSRVAFLKAMTLRDRTDLAPIRDEAAELATLAISARIDFEAVLTTVSPLVAKTSIVRDVEKALRRVTADLEVLAGRQ